MGDGVVLAHKGHQQEAVRAAVSASSAPPSLALGAMEAVQGSLGTMAEAVRVSNPIPMARKWVLDKQEAFSAWLSKQSIPVEAAVSTGIAALQGAALGAVITTLNKDMARSLEASPAQRAALGLDPNAANPSVLPEGLVGGPIIQARNFAVLMGTSAGISCVLKRLRGVDDIQNSMAAAFGSGFVFQLVSSTGAPNIAGAVGTGACFALAQGGFYKVGEMMSKERTPKKPTKEDLYYAKARRVLMRLGLERYEKNFRQGMLTDATLPLLTDSALRDVRIPPGPRLIILDHIQRDPELMQGRESN